MLVKELIRELLEFDQNAMVFVLTKMEDIEDVMTENVPNLKIGTVNEEQVVVLVSDFDKYRKEEEKVAKEVPDEKSDTSR